MNNDVGAVAVRRSSSASRVGSARALAAMVGVSKEWRAAVTNESWCRVTCMRFPRVVAIVTALELETPVYREVYRE